MNILHFETTPEDEKLFQNSPLLEGNTTFAQSILHEETKGQTLNAEVITVFVNSVVNKSVIDALPHCKLIVTRSTGFDHIDTTYARSRGITVCNVPAYGSRTVAEFTYALMLALSRKVFHAAEQIKLSNNWDISTFEGFNLQGKTLGIIGTGKIGQNVAHIAKGFDLKVIAYDAFPNEAASKELGFNYVALNELLAASDIITVHVPGNADTYHLINTSNLYQIKKGALLINTARGEVVESAALVKGLQEGILEGVALDVLEGEHDLKEEAELLARPETSQEKLKILLEDHILISHPKVIVTPHIAFNSIEARTDIISTTLENIKHFTAGEPTNVVNP